MHAKHYKLRTILWTRDNCMRICERHYTFVFRDTKTLSFSLGHIRVSCKCTSKTLNNYEGFLLNYANTAIDIYEWRQRTITFYWDIMQYTNNDNTCKILKFYSFFLAVSNWEISSVIIEKIEKQLCSSQHSSQLISISLGNIQL